MPDQRQTMAAKAATVLVVEPEEPIRCLLQEALRKTGYRVCGVDDLEKAADLCSLFDFDVIISGSFAQPPVDYWSGLLRLRQAAAEVPIVIATAYGVEYFDGYGERGFADVVNKPFDLHDLLNRVSVLADISRRSLGCPAPGSDAFPEPANLDNPF